MKHFETEQDQRVNATYKSKVNPHEEPLFYGTRRVDLSAMTNSNEIRSAIFSKLAQTIESQLRQANRQFSEYRARNPRKNSLSICLLLNSQIDAFSPDVVMHSVQRKIQPTAEGPRFSNIDAVIYISEKHYQKLSDGRIAFAIVTIVGAEAIEQAWKLPLVDLIGQRWSEFRTGATPAAHGHPDKFESIEDIPDTMRRHEAWKLAYKRKPYLSNLTDDQLKIHFHRCVAINSLTFLRGSWPKPSDDETATGLRQFDDAISEINRRGLDMRQFDPKALSEDDRLKIYAGLPAELVNIFSRPQSY